MTDKELWIKLFGDFHTAILSSGQPLLDKTDGAYSRYALDFADKAMQTIKSRWPEDLVELMMKASDRAQKARATLDAIEKAVELSNPNNETEAMVANLNRTMFIPHAQRELNDAEAELSRLQERIEQSQSANAEKSQPMNEG